MMSNEVLEGAAIKPLTPKSKQLSTLSFEATSKSFPDNPAIDDIFFHSPLFDLYDRIFNWLVVAGFKHQYYPLWELALKGRSLVVVNDPGLHLTCTDGLQFIKPLPPCFGRSDIIPTLSANGGKALEHARGFFHSYTKLIQSKCDYDIAIRLGLLPDPWLSRPGIEGWEIWQGLVTAWNEADTPDGGEERNETLRLPLPRACHRRYIYGELRLTRLNWIMWLLYLPYYFGARPDEAWPDEPYRHRPYFYITQDPFGRFWLGYEHRIGLIFTVYVTVVLIAMLVALAARDMPQWFKDGCSVFSYGVISFVLGHAALFMIYLLLWVIVRLWGFLRLQLIRNHRRHNKRI